MSDTPLIQQIRTASRLMVRELGFMNTTLAATHYSPSAVHTLLEVSVRGTITAAQLVTLLGLEKSSVSRMVARLLAAGELEERPCAEDARSKSLALTAKGHDTVATINAYGTRRVVEALAHLDETQQRTVASGLAAYAQALAQCRDAALAETTPQISLVTGYQPGAIGRIAQMHGEYYARHHDFGAFLKARLPAASRNSPPGSPRRSTRSGWRWREGKIVGSVAIDGEDLGQQQAHLRWFILDDSCRGTGIGRRLLSEAMAFCDSRQFSAVQLWTFKGLDAARKLYESFGFTLTREWQGDQWGKMMTEQQFTRPGNAG